MSYLETLKRLDAIAPLPAKPAEVGYAGFAGTVGGGIAEINALAATVATHDPEERKACSWMITLPEGQLLTVYVPAVPLDWIQRDHPTMIGATIAQGCRQCLWNIHPGQGAGAYCSSHDRKDQPGPYGQGHPARFLAEDGGAACEYFEGLHNGSSVNDTKL